MAKVSQEYLHIWNTCVLDLHLLPSVCVVVRQTAEGCVSVMIHLVLKRTKKAVMERPAEEEGYPTGGG